MSQRLWSPSNLLSAGRAVLGRACLEDRDYDQAAQSLTGSSFSERHPHPYPLQPQSWSQELPGPIWKRCLHLPHPLQLMHVPFMTRALFSTSPVWGPLPPQSVTLPYPPSQ